MLQPDDQSKDYESAMGVMTLDSASSMGMEERGIKDMERELDVKKNKVEWIKSDIKAKYQTINHVKH